MCRNIKRLREREEKRLMYSVILLALYLLFASERARMNEAVYNLFVNKISHLIANMNVQSWKCIDTHTH
jgi:hypothetical protein